MLHLIFIYTQAVKRYTDNGIKPDVNIPEYDKKILPNAVRLAALYVFASIDFSSKLNFGVTCRLSSMPTTVGFSISLANVCMIGKITSMTVMISNRFIFFPFSKI
ncbi:MAG: hypothetical protein II196_03515 [Spirochaetales bacterium]|nr:hypothetical protein [Spirochaetales bacterium]